MKLNIGHLYGDLMNTYGDDGNIVVLQKRAKWRGIEASIKRIPLNYQIKPLEFNLYFFGGGQDQAQQLISQDLIKHHQGKVLEKDIKRGVPLLAICGGYQLLGEYYKPQNQPKLPGLGVLPIITIASSDRMIGNLVISSQFGSLVGFENHSGKTFFKKPAAPLGTVVKGFGNNGEDKTEGCIFYNTIGCYMHGSLLPKNPCLADWLLKKALEVKYQKDIELSSLDDSLEEAAHNQAVKLFS